LSLQCSICNTLLSHTYALHVLNLRIHLLVNPRSALVSVSSDQKASGHHSSHLTSSHPGCRFATGHQTCTWVCTQLP
jgi:hypothetical protein